MNFVRSIEQVLPCLVNAWKIRMIAHLDSPPDLREIASSLDARYSEKLGVVIVRIGLREVNFFASGKVTVRLVDDIDEGKALVNSVLALCAHRQFLKEHDDA